MNQEQNYLSSLASAQSYRISGNTLSLSTGISSLSFAAAQGCCSSCTAYGVVLYSPRLLTRVATAPALFAVDPRLMSQARRAFEVPIASLME